MKLDELRRQFRARKRSREEIADEMDAFIAEKRLGLARCDCGHLVEEHSGPLARPSLRDSAPILPAGYCFNCSCTHPTPVAAFSEMPLPKMERAAAATSDWAEKRAEFAKEIEGEWSAKFLTDDPASLLTTLPTLKDATRGDTETIAKKLLGSYAYHIKDLFGSPGEGDLVWRGERDARRNPINHVVPADRLFVVESVECRHCEASRSMRGRGPVLPACRFCNGLGRDISVKSAKLFRRPELK